MKQGSRWGLQPLELRGGVAQSRRRCPRHGAFPSHAGAWPHPSLCPAPAPFLRLNLSRGPLQPLLGLPSAGLRPRVPWTRLPPRRAGPVPNPGPEALQVTAQLSGKGPPSPAPCPSPPRRRTSAPDGARAHPPVSSHPPGPRGRSACRWRPSGGCSVAAARGLNCQRVPVTAAARREAAAGVETQVLPSLSSGPAGPSPAGEQVRCLPGVA